MPARIPIALALLALLGPADAALSAKAPVGQPLFRRSLRTGQETVPAVVAHLLETPTTQRATMARFDARALEADRLVLNPFPDIALEARPTPIGFSGARHRVWFGTLDADRGSAVFVLNGDRVSGKINSLRGTFEIFPLEAGECSIVEHDLSQFPACGVDSRSLARRTPIAAPVLEVPAANQADTGKVASAADPAPEAATAGDTLSENRVRVIVAYTEGAQFKTLVFYGRTMQEHVDLAMAEANLGYANSGVDFRLELACLYRTDTTESTAIAADVDDFRNAGDGRFDEVHQLRDDYDADMCCLVTDGRDFLWAGWAYGFDYTSRDNMFQATSYSAATAGFSFAHEFGHLQGCRHNDDPAVSPFAYGHGLRNESYWRTIMALANATTAPRLNYWSNPDLLSPVFPYTALGTPPDGANFANDCRSALNNGAGTVINHETTPFTSTAPTGHSLGEDEYADKVVNDTLTVGTFVAHPGSTVQFRAGNCIRLQPGFWARSGSEFQARLANPLGDPLTIPALASALPEGNSSSAHSDPSAP